MGCHTKTKVQKRQTLLGLPTELRLHIFDLIYISTTVEIYRGYPGTEAEDDEDEDEYDPPPQAISPVPTTPNDILSLKLTCRAINKEIKDSDWHSQVTYDFPSTVAFIDVLSQWPQSKIESLRHVRVDDSPLPLYPYADRSYYNVTYFDAALPMFPGLKLDTLTVGNMWLAADGSEIDGLCGIATNFALSALLYTKGWKKLYYTSGILGITPSQRRSHARRVKDEREKGFEFGFGRVRPNWKHILGAASDEEKAEVEAWYAAHPEEGKMGEFPELEDFQVGMWAKRGEGADYVQDGEGIEPMIKELQEKVGWVKLRRTNQWLVNDGLDDPTSHF